MPTLRKIPITARQGANIMPEQITKFPDVTLRVLKSAGAVCGEGATQKILTKCPAERFCALPSGEICVYGIDEIPQMTQIDVHEIAAVVAPEISPGITALSPTWGLAALILGVGFLIGFTLGRYRRRKNQR
jgi:hypothetical protein